MTMFLSTISMILHFLTFLCLSSNSRTAAFSTSPHSTTTTTTTINGHVSAERLKFTRTRSACSNLFMTHNNNQENDNVVDEENGITHSLDEQLSRRSMISSSAAFCGILGSGVLSNPAAHAASETLTGSSNDASASASEFPPVTHRVFMDLRISRSDGSFYVRDDLPDIPENRVYNGRLVIGLFGTASPNHVAQFLRYAAVTYNPTEDDPLPSYGRSSFVSLDQQTGLMVGGKIPGLETALIGGSNVLKYGTRVLPATLWSDRRSDLQVSHSAGKGLLTHRNLDVTPSFGITTRPAGFDLDGSYTVFGKILSDEGSYVGGGGGKSDDEAKTVSFLSVVQDIPTYSMDRPAPPADAQPTEGERAVQEIASAVFSTQREFFRGAAKTFGDTRLDKVYEGKLLRRVEVTKVGIL